MKKYLSIAVGLMLVLSAAPVFADNDVTLSPGSARITVGSYTFDLFGSSDELVDSLTVTDTNFALVLSPGRGLTVVSNNRRKLAYSADAGITVNSVCSGTSQLGILAAGTNTSTATITITPSSTEQCDTTTTSSSGSGSGGGGGGGSGAVNNPNSILFSQTTTSSSVTPATTQVSLPAQASPMAAVTTGIAAVKHTFKTALKYGLTSADVTELQNRLTAEGVYSGPITGYFGSLTLAAVKKYQEKNGIATAGQAGYGNVGPATRAKLNASAAAVPASTEAAVSVPAAAAQMSSAQVETLQTQIQALQAQLLLLLNQKMELLKAQ